MSVLSLSALYFKANVNFSMYKITFRKVNKYQSEERNHDKRGQDWEGERTTNFKNWRRPWFNFFWHFCCFACLSEYQERARRFEIFQVRVLPSRNSTENNNQTKWLTCKQRNGRDRWTYERTSRQANERAKKETNERPLDPPTDRPTDQPNKQYSTHMTSNSIQATVRCSFLTSCQVLLIVFIFCRFPVQSQYDQNWEHAFFAREVDW